MTVTRATMPQPDAIYAAGIFFANHLKKAANNVR
jgi:hypothetical protein